MSDLVTAAAASAFMPTLSTQCSPEVWALAISTASEAVIDLLGWDPTQQTVTETYDGTGVNFMVVNRAPITSIASIVVWPSTTPMDLSQVVTKNRQIISRCAQFCRGYQNVTITYTAGYASIPLALQQATFYTMNAQLQGASADPNATGESYQGVLTRAFWPTGPGSVPPQALQLINNSPDLRRFLAP